MSANLKFEDNSVQVKNAIEKACVSWLEEAAGEIESATKRNTRVKTGNTKGSFTHVVDEGAMKATIGSPLENAIWEEFGTGEYAAKGDGRKGGWVYKDDATGKFYRTRGKKPSRAMQKAFKSIKPKLQKALSAKLKGMK